MTREEIIKRYPRASESFIRANLSVGDTGPVAKLECDPCHAPLAKEKVQRSTGKRFLVCITSIRKRLLDQDNLAEKYHVDLCRYAGIIPDDSPAQIEIQTGQRKAIKGEEEHTVIEIFQIHSHEKRAGQKQRKCRILKIQKVKARFGEGLPSYNRQSVDEKSVIVALKKYQWNVIHAASSLGISRQVVRRVQQDHELPHRKCGQPKSKKPESCSKCGVVKMLKARKMCNPCLLKFYKSKDYKP